MAVRPCLRCGRLCDGTTYCPACRAARWADQDRRRGQRPWYDGSWRTISKQARAAQPWCSRCGATTNLEADHVMPRSLTAGVRVLCHPCHAKVGRRTRTGGRKSR